jgi:hypothetical protein
VRVAAGSYSRHSAMWLGSLSVGIGIYRTRGAGKVGLPAAHSRFDQLGKQADKFRAGESLGFGIGTARLI